MGKAFYGLKTSGARFHEKLADTMRGLGFTRSKADQDVWMRDAGDHCALGSMTHCTRVRTLKDSMTPPENLATS